jgi:hypothetical protein
MDKNNTNNDRFLEALEERATEYRNVGSNPMGRDYKFLAERLGAEPWRVIVPLAFGVGVAVVLLLKGWAVKGVTLLQYGF